ncbi:MAG: hypothetical protein LJE70_00805 [Chromatiaceae bacterium]|jgi:hypothetical protein|nr:hypothetical protein [Chromatiaceae bacterium]
MMMRKPWPLDRGRLLIPSLLPLVVACTSTGRHVSDWGEITLAPGDTGTCLSNPCRVFFEMPPGEGTYLVTANEIKVGDFPAGKTVMLGSFFESNAIKLPGTDVPHTYIYVPSSSGSSSVP